MSHIRPLFVTEDVFTAIGRPYAIYPLDKSQRPLVGMNKRVVGSDISSEHSLHLSVNAVCIESVATDSGNLVHYMCMKFAKERWRILDCAVYSSLIREAHAKFTRRHNCAKRIEFTRVLLNRGIDIYLAMSIAREYI